MKKSENSEITDGNSCKNTENISGIDLTRKLLESALDTNRKSYEYDQDDDWFHGQYHEFDNLFVIWQITPGFNGFRVKSYTVGNSVDDAKQQEALTFCKGRNVSYISSEAYIDDVSEELVLETELDFDDEVSEDFIRRRLSDLFDSHIEFFEEALEWGLIENNLRVSDLQEQ